MTDYLGPKLLEILYMLGHTISYQFLNRSLTMRDWSWHKTCLFTILSVSYVSQIFQETYALRKSRWKEWILF